MIETRRVAQVLADLEGINEDLLNLYEEVRRDGDSHDPAARRENLALLTEYNDKLEAFELAATSLQAVIERITNVSVDPYEEGVPQESDVSGAHLGRELHPSAPHYLGENFTLKHVGSFTFFNRRFQVRRWKHLYRAVLNHLADRFPEQFRQLPDTPPFNDPHRTRGFYRSTARYRAPLSLPYGVYCETSLSAEDMCINMQRLLKHLGVPERELVIYLRD